MQLPFDGEIDKLFDTDNLGEFGSNRTAALLEEKL
jgi:hypothetical protein